MTPSRRHHGPPSPGPGRSAEAVASLAARSPASLTSARRCGGSAYASSASSSLAVMTGPAGTNAAPTSGFTGPLQFPRLFWFLGLRRGAVRRRLDLAVLRRIGRSRGANRIRVVNLQADGAETSASGPRRGDRRRSASSGCRGSHRTTPGRAASASRSAVRCAAMELVVYLFESRSLRVARPAGYAVIALYGVLAVDAQRVSRST